MARRYARRILMLVLITLVGLTGEALSASAVAAQGSWYGEYYSNASLAGEPALTRYDNMLRFDWGGGSPGSGLPKDGFSVRWTREQWFDSGTYRFSYRSDDGLRVWVDGGMVVDDWRHRQAGWSFVDRYVSRGTHVVRVEYFEDGGHAQVEVLWERITGGAAWRGEYFDNRKLTGGAELVRYDAAIDFDWGADSPDPRIPSDDFSVRWSRTLGFTSGTYRFHASCDDGVRIFVDGGLIVDSWRDQKLPNTRTGEIYLIEGQHTVVVEYYDHGGEASAHVWWNRLGGFNGWEGRYYDNVELRGGPALLRDDPEISFDWGEGAPVDWMPADQFSVRWSRTMTFAPGFYRFSVQSDDGVRVWLDKGLLMDYWQPMTYEHHYVDGVYLEGSHHVEVAYFERAGGARIRFWWGPSGTSSAVPAPAPAPSQAPISASARRGPWYAEYYDNDALAGPPALVRTDAALDFNWGWTAPAVGINRDAFSVRWTGDFGFDGGRYVFTTTSDDGIRVSVDGKRVIDAWVPMRGTRRATLDLSPGTHTVEVEYFERFQAAMVRLTWAREGIEPPAAGGRVPSPAPAFEGCQGGPLRLEAWPVDKERTPGGWKVTIYARAYGGDCRYTYGWERQAVAGPTIGAVTFDVETREGAMVGEASVTSAGETVKRGLYVRPPEHR